MNWRRNDDDGVAMDGVEERGRRGEVEVEVGKKEKPFPKQGRHA